MTGQELREAARELAAAAPPLSEEQKAEIARELLATARRHRAA